MLFDGDFRYINVFFVWFFGFCNAAELCEVDNQTIVLPVCTSTVQSGNHFVISTSNVASKTLACNCSFGMNYTFGNLDIDFKVNGRPGCGLIFSVLSSIHYCNSSGTTLLNGTDYWTVHFGNAGVEASVCLKIIMDDLESQSYSLTCENNSQTMSSSTSKYNTAQTFVTEDTSVVTNTDKNVPTTNELETIRATTETSSEGHSSSLDKTTTVTMESKHSNITETAHGIDNTEINTGAIAAAAGGGGVFLLVICVCTIICCYRYRKKKANDELSLKHHAFGAADLEVTYNVAYNMEFSNGIQRDQTQLQDNAAIYNVLDEDEEKIPKAIHRPLSYENVLENDEEINYNNFESGDEQQGMVNRTAVEIKIPHIYEGDERLYDSVPLEESTHTESTAHDESELKSTIKYDESNEIKDAGQTAYLEDNTDILIYEHNRGADVTYAVVDPIDPVNKENDRPNQIADLESDYTYATVNRITT